MVNWFLPLHFRKEMSRFCRRACKFFFFFPPPSDQAANLCILMIFGKMKENNYKRKRRKWMGGLQNKHWRTHGFWQNFRLTSFCKIIWIDHWLPAGSNNTSQEIHFLYRLFSVNVPVLFSLPIGMKSARVLPVSLCLSMVMVRSAHKRDWVMSQSGPSLRFSPILWLRQGSQHICRLWSSGYFISFN